ncbi:MAG: hypothetical protein KC420_07355 [Myxococcales bacterium]|nr:hypothetical protein [Myxococcales bacterium]MCB9569308.1 hypothetical protein [Myxococcales bacterium]MCB9705905.1 hypothetical protein [Myxococcales bacterium]
MLTPLHILVQQLLLGRTEDLSPSQLAAFIAGWTSLLDLLERPEICFPEGPDELREGLFALTQRIRRAQEEILDDETA